MPPLPPADTEPCRPEYVGGDKPGTTSRHAGVSRSPQAVSKGTAPAQALVTGEGLAGAWTTGSHSHAFRASRPGNAYVYTACARSRDVLTHAAVPLCRWEGRGDESTRGRAPKLGSLTTWRPVIEEGKRKRTRASCGSPSRYWPRLTPAFRARSRKQIAGCAS